MLDGLLETLGVSAATVVGNSMGGFVSTELAIAFPQRVERLVLVSAAGISTYRHRDVERIEPYLRRLAPMVAVYTGWTAAQLRLGGAPPGLRNLTLGSRDAPSEPAARGARGRAVARSRQARLHAGAARQHRLSDQGAPAGDRVPDVDRVGRRRQGDPGCATRACSSELIPNSRKVIFEDTGHMAMLERPAAFNGLLSEFIAE